jgi:hypothetical protein
VKKQVIKVLQILLIQHGCTPRVSILRFRPKVHTRPVSCSERRPDIVAVGFPRRATKPATIARGLATPGDGRLPDVLRQSHARREAPINTGLWWNRSNPVVNPQRTLHRLAIR